MLPLSPIGNPTQIEHYAAFFLSVFIFWLQSFLFSFAFIYPLKGEHYQQKTEATLTSTFRQRNQIGNDICETQTVLVGGIVLVDLAAQ